MHINILLSLHQYDNYSQFREKILKLLTLGDGIASGPKINNHRFSMLLLCIGQNEEYISDL